MKKLLLSLSIGLLALVVTAQITVTVNVATAGGLSEAIASAGGDAKTATNLTVTGNIDARDIKYMRDDMSVLSILNLATVQIVAYTGIEGTNISLTSYPANEMPQYSFWTLSTKTGKISLTGITLPNSLSSIGIGAFARCISLTGSLTIPNSVTKIEEGAFFDCHGFTGNLTIPNSVTSIGGYAFEDCSSFTGSLIIGNSVTSIGDHAFDGCSGFTGSLSIPNSVTSIGQSAFSNCRSFTGSLTIPNSITSIESRVFAGCYGFTGSLTIPNLVTYIGKSAFSNCGSLTGNLTIPNSVTYIGESAFQGCQGFTGSLTIPNSVAFIGEEAFQNCEGFSGSLIIGNSVTSIGKQTFYNCGGFTGSLIIGNSVTSIEHYAFYGCKGLTGSLTIPNSVSYIGERAFNGCKGLTGSLIIPNSVTSIGDAAFDGCSSLTGSLTIGDLVTSIGQGAFMKCSGFTGNLTIPKSVSSIEIYAFDGCSGFNGNLTIPNSVTYIGDYAFEGCSGLQKITVARKVPIPIEGWTFAGVKNTCQLVVPLGSKTAYQTAYVWEEFTNITEAIFVSFNSQAGSYINDTIVDYNTTIVSPTPPTKAGYIFDSWYKEAECNNLWAFATDKVIDNTTLYAKWIYSPNTINVPVAGGLPEAIIAAGFNAETMNNIKITGFIDIRDIYFMRDSMPSLSLLDLETITLVAYNSPVNKNAEITDNIKITGYIDSPANKMPDYSFYNQSTSIGKRSLTRIKLPSSLTSIGTYAFYGCSGLQKITVAKRIPLTIDGWTFEGVNKTTCQLVVPKGSKPAYQEADYWKDFTNITEANFVSFNTQGGTFIADAIVDDNATIILPTPPTKTGYTFGDWYKEAACNNLWAFATDKVITNTTLYAKWIYSPTIINVPVAGGLSTAIIVAGFNAETINNMIITGYIDSRDIYFIRDSMPVLTTLNMEAVNIMAHNDSPANKIPDYSFFNPNTSLEKTKLTGIKFPINLTSIGNSAFKNCSDLSGSLTIPNSVTSIGDYAFYSCSGFTGSLTIPNSVTSIGGFAFRYCSGFTGSLTIPNSVTSIGDDAFYGCSGFTGSLTIGNSVTSIGFGIFSTCRGFTGSLTIPNSVTSIGAFAFSGCNGFTGSLTIPNSVTSIEGFAFGGCNGFTGSLTIPNSVTSIGDSAFNGCSGFTGSLTIPNSVIIIGRYTFEGCSGFTGSLTIPNSVISIGNYAFNGCSGFTGSLTIGNSITYIGMYTFYGCSSFTGSLTIPNSVHSIGESAFQGCQGFTGSLNIPNSVTYIGNGAFKDCSGLQKITVAQVVPLSITSNTFNGVNKTTCQLVVPKGSKPAYQAASYWKDFKNILEEDMLNTGIDYKTAFTQLYIYPNPAINVVRVEGSNMKQITIYNLLGTLVMRHNPNGANGTEINVDKLKTGNYFVRVTNGNGKMETIKLIKQ